MEPGYRTALVTGATGKVGTALVRRLRALGLKVHAIGRSEGALKELANATGCVPIVLDLTDTAALEAQVAGLSIEMSWCATPA